MEIGRIQPVKNQQNQMNQTTQNPGSFNREAAHPKAEEQANSNASPTEKDIIKAVDSLNKMFDSAQSHIQFTYHEKLGEYYIKIINDQKNEVIKEIPSKKILDMVAEMKKSIGLLIDEKI